jgi:hypothetical protein
MTTQLDQFLDNIKDKVFNINSEVTYSTNKIDEFSKFAKTMMKYSNILKNPLHRKVVIQLLEIGFIYTRQITRDFNLSTTNHIREIIENFLDFDIIQKHELEDHEKEYLKSISKLNNFKINQIVAYELTPEAKTFFLCMRDEIFKILQEEAIKDKQFLKDIKEKKEQLATMKTKTKNQQKTTIATIVNNSEILDKKNIIEKYKQLGIKTIYDYMNIYVNYYQFFRLGKLKFKDKLWVSKETVLELHEIINDGRVG